MGVWAWLLIVVVFFFKQKTAYEMRISDWSSDVCSSDLRRKMIGVGERAQARKGRRSHEDQSFAGVEAGNQRRPNQKATPTSRMRTGTSTSGPITAAKATADARPKAAMAAAIASSKLLPAAGKATAVVRG